MHPKDTPRARARGKRRQLLGAAIGVVAAATAITSAFAQIINDPTGNNLFAIGTAPGDNVSANDLAVSNGGNASSSFGVAVSIGGSASSDGTAAISLGPNASGTCCVADVGTVAVAVNPTGDATACGMVGVAVAYGNASGCGIAVGWWVAGSLLALGITGARDDCRGWFGNEATVYGSASQSDCTWAPAWERSAVSVFGPASTCNTMVGAVAVSVGSSASNCAGPGLMGEPSTDGPAVALGGAGSAQSSNHNGIAVSGEGDSHGGLVAVSGTGNATGGWVAVSGTGTAYACGGPINVAESVTGNANLGGWANSCPGSAPVAPTHGTAVAASAANGVQP